jgi:hypothetical protein
MAWRNGNQASAWRNQRAIMAAKRGGNGEMKWHQRHQ